MKNKSLKLIAALLSAVMVFSLVPFSAVREIYVSADDEEENLFEPVLCDAVQTTEIDHGLISSIDEITIEPMGKFSVDLTASFDLEFRKKVFNIQLSPITAYMITVDISDTSLLTLDSEPLQNSYNISDNGVYRSDSTVDAWTFSYNSAISSLVGMIAEFTFRAGEATGDVTVECTITTAHEDGEYAQSSCSFNVTVANPTHISSAEEFMSITDFNGFYKLDCDLDLSDYALSERPNCTLSGTFDGCGHTITGLTNELFYQMGSEDDLSSVLKNLVLDGQNSSRSGSFCVNNYGYICNCINLSDIETTDFAGGICTYNYYIIERCVNYGDIKVTASNVGGFAGGISGADYGYLISECANYGDITVNIPEPEGAVSKDVVQTVTRAAAAGGIAGTSMGEIYDSANYGNTSAYGAEYMNYTTSENELNGIEFIYLCGGIVGNGSSNYITNCFSSTSSLFCLYELSYSIVETSYFISDESEANEYCGTAVSTANASAEESYPTLSFFSSPDVKHYWKMGEEYPVLANIPLLDDGTADVSISSSKIYGNVDASLTVSFDREITASQLLIEVGTDSGYIQFSNEDITFNSDYPITYRYNDEKCIVVEFDGEQTLSGDIFTIPLFCGSESYAPNGSYTLSCKIVTADSEYNYSVLSVADSSLRVVDYVYGDVNGDCRFNTTDAVELLFYYTGLKTVNFTDYFSIPSHLDINGDSQCNAADAVWLLWNLFWPEEYTINWDTGIDG